MVHNTLDLVSQIIHNSLQKSHKKPSITQQLMTTTLLNKTRIIPLMAQPYEVINVTTSGTQDASKPPDKPNG
jgi:hypothetical protein